MTAPALVEPAKADRASCQEGVDRGLLLPISGILAANARPRRWSFQGVEADVLDQVDVQPASAMARRANSAMLRLHRRSPK